MCECTHERVVTRRRGLCVSLFLSTHTHAHRAALMTIVSGPCRWQSSLQPLINPIDLSQGSKVMGVLIGESALCSKASPDSRQINDASVTYITCVFISHRIIRFGLAFDYPVCLYGAAYRAPRPEPVSLVHHRCTPSPHRRCSGHGQWCSGWRAAG